MKKNILLFGSLLFISISLQAQKKSELIAEIDNLKSQLDSVSQEVAKARRAESASLAKAESFESQVGELQAANATMMKNLTSFAEVSNKNSENINKAMASLRAKENQLKSINDALASNDSTAIVILTNAKQTLGENAKISVTNGMVNISTALTALFAKDSEAVLKPEAEAWIGKIANILNANPKIAVTVEGLNITGDFALSAQQAMAVSNMLQAKFSIDANRLRVIAKDGNFKEGINLRLHPDFSQFYMMVKDNMKN
ncbi:OmpA family protein [Costertonia aggregata]|uniref:OmpA-like domain-containing protein n=1 Tax=Costertonia aggregata TaxID=343403 RepID=A0A7H9AUK4_9FLAO|nr:OmpA family protein [Costertonia aggregata]QLG46875.1 hypothetical protein HYG79_16445 [Costertonia aggregata]